MSDRLAAALAAIDAANSRDPGSAPDVPQPLVDQLAVGGQLLVPVGGRDEQVLLRVRRTETGMTRTRLDAMRFVPLIGAHGFSS